MPLLPNDHDLTRRAIDMAERLAIDANTVEDALNHHSELLDLLAMQAMIVKASSQSEPAKEAAIRDINACAVRHRDIVDRLTDVIESKKQLTWRQ